MLVKIKENSVITVKSFEETGVFSPCSLVPKIMSFGFSRKEADTVLSIMGHGMTLEQAIKQYKSNLEWASN